jgi:ankyrin repeat protein
MNNLPDKNQIKDLILNDIKNSISNFNNTITIPYYVYDMFKDEFKDKGYRIIKKENDNYNISIPLLNGDKKEINNLIFKKIIDNKQFDELLNYTKFDLNYNFKELLKNCKNEKILKHVIDNAVDLECEDKYKMRPIHCICYYSTPEMIKYIIDKGVNLECETINKMRPIHLICVYSTPELIKYIIDKGVNLECENYYKQKPIHYICQYSTPEMIKYIIDKGVDLECRTNAKWRPIHFICQYSTHEMIKYIIDKGIKTKFDINNLILGTIKDNRKLSNDEKDKIIDYVTFKNLLEKYKIPKLKYHKYIKF